MVGARVRARASVRVRGGVGLHISFWFSFCLVTASRLANLCSFSVAMKLVTCLGLGLG